MRNIFNFKKLSWKIACIVGITVVIFAGGVAAYMEYRIITEINQYSDLYLRDRAKASAQECNLALSEAANETGVA